MTVLKLITFGVPLNWLLGRFLMADEALKSQQITDMDASPRVPTNARLSGGHVLIAKAKIETLLAAAGTGSTYRMVRVPSNAMIHAVYLAADDMGTTGDVDVGVYLPNGGAVKDADLFGSAVDVNAAALVRTDVTFESGQYNLDETEKPLWEVLGDKVDTSPNGYDIVIGPSEAFTSLGTMLLEVWYTV